MIKPDMPNLPGIGAMNETFDFVKNLWGGMGMPGMSAPGMKMPGMVMPTLSVEEINKKIADLKAVESWLTLNMNMLRSTIQALEVQAATITALQTMGQNFAAGMQSGGKDKGAAGAAGGGTNGSKPEPKSSAGAEPNSRDEATAANLTAPLTNAAAWWNVLQGQFKQAVGNAMAAEAAEQKDKPKPKPAAKPAAAPAAVAARKRKPAAK